MRIKETISILLEALPEDSFRIVRKSNNQAIEVISSRDAISALQVATNNDNFLENRLWARRAIDRLSQL